MRQDDDDRGGAVVDRWNAWRLIIGAPAADDAIARESPCAISRQTADVPLSSSLSVLDVDSLRAIAAHLQEDAKLVRVDTECCPAVLALALCSRLLHVAMCPLLASMHQSQKARREGFLQTCLMLGTTWDALVDAHSLHVTRGYRHCTGCGTALPNCRFLFAQTPHASYRRPADEVIENAAAHDNDGEAEEAGEEEGSVEAEQQQEEAEEPPILELERGLPYCAHCWRYAYGLSMRPGATGFEQTWEAPIEEGSYALVQDFANVEELDSPLLSLEEFSQSDHWINNHEYGPNTRALHVGLNASGYVLAMGPTAGRALQRAMHVADLLSSGYADHILSLVLSGCELDDAAMELLSRALVGNCLFLQYLDLEDNLYGGEGIEAFATQLRAPKRTLILPCLRCLQLQSLPPLLDVPPGLAMDESETLVTMDRGLGVLAEAVREFALPCLEAVFVHPRLLDVYAVHAASDVAQERVPGLNSLFDECGERGIWCGDAP